MVIGFTGTPLCDKPAEYEQLKAIIKGDANKDLNDEGFVSFFNGTPSEVFPRVAPAGVPASLPESMVRSVRLRNLPSADCGVHFVKGNRS